MKQSRLASGRIIVKNPSEVAQDRYQFLDLASAEPNLGTASNGSILTTTVSGQRIFTTNISISNATLTGNLRADAVYTENLFYANGEPFITGAIENPSNIYNGRVTAGTTQTLIDSFDVSGITSVRWVLSAVDSVNTAYKTSTIDSSNDGTNIFYNEFAILLSDNENEVANYFVEIAAGQIRLYATGTSASVPITYQRTTLGSSTTVGNLQGISYSSNSVGSGTATTVVVDNFVGNGSTTAYTLSVTPSTKNQTLIAIGGIVQPKTTYNLSGNVITFGSAPPVGAPIEIQTFVLTTITGYTGSAGTGGGGGGNGYTGSAGFTGSAGSFSGTTSQPIVTTNTTASTSTGTGALRVSGGAGVAGNLNVGGDIFVTGNILPTSNNVVNLGSPTARFGTIYISANTIDIGGTTISATPTGDLSFVTPSGSVDITANSINFLNTVAVTEIAPGEAGPIGYTGSRGAAGFTGSVGIGFTGSRGEASAPVATIYATAASLPASGVATGTLAYVTDVARLFIYNGTIWVNTAPSTKNFFYILQTGLFTAPITGAVSYSPTRTITLSSLEATIAQAESANIVFSVMKNGTTLQSFTLLAGQTSIESDFGNNTITTSDVVTMNIVSGSGKDLSVRFIYT